MNAVLGSFTEEAQARYQSAEPLEELFDLSLSKALTAGVKRLHPDFGNVLLLVKGYAEQRPNHEHVVDFSPNTKDVMIGDCKEFGSLALEVMSNPALAELVPGLEMMVHHELGHQRGKGEAFVLQVKDGFVHLNTGILESVAQLYALTKLQRPIEGMAALLAMQEHIQPQKTVEGHFRSALTHWSNDGLMQDLGYQFSFPLSDSAIQRTVQKAHEYVAKLGALCSRTYQQPLPVFS